MFHTYAMGTWKTIYNHHFTDYLHYELRNLSEENHKKEFIYYVLSYRD
jgi:hypothetical protein